MGDNSEKNCEKSSRESEMEEFRQNLREKREQRQTVLSNFRKKFAKLERENSKLRDIIENAGLKVDFDDELDAKSADMCTSSTIVASPDDSDHQQDDDDDHVTSIKTNLAETQHELQLANANVLSLTSELSAIKRQVVSLKEVNTISKQLMEIRETEVNQLRAKLRDIEESIADREMVIMSENLRNEYIRQLDNMKNLKVLYEQRARASDLEMETLRERLIASENRLKEQVDKNQEQENHIHQLENDLSITQNQLVDSKCEIETIQTEYGAINQLFGRMLMGFNSGNDNLDIDKLTEILEEHRLLLSNITNNEESLIANNFLPKVLYDLVTQATEKEDNETENDEKTVENSSCSNVDRREISSTEEIIGNLPKVWRILTELLSHQKKINPVPLQEDGQNEDCYKSVQTPSGPQLVLSVSKTYIKLKNLILEKKSLTKETNRLKTLNSHLERTLESQEKRLGVVSVELTKTWHLVNRLQRQHRQLHTQEQVLRYQLQQKRRLLLELKEELEYCRVKWAKAREKNEDSEVQWESLRREFASRKDGSASAESGYSDDPVSEDDEDDGKSAGDVDSDEEIQKIPTIIPQVIDKKNPSNETLEEMFNRISGSVQEENPPEIVENTSPRATTPPENNLENNAANVENAATSTSNASTSVLTENEEDYTARRAARLKRLEEECKTFMAKMTENRNRGSQLCNHLDRVHTRFGDNRTVEENANESSLTPDTTTIPTPSDPETTTRRTTQLEHHEGECKSVVDAQMSMIECNLEQVNNSTDLTTNPQGGILTATEENYTSRRSERIQRLEAQCRELMDKMTANRNRGEELSDQLDEMHQRFSSRSSSEAPSSQSPDPPDNTPENHEKEEDPGENFP
ncbi:CAP-Gly domain-containing linker protein 1 [Phlebotomus papatasi]|uniref:CAP-Gly domain-containing linker protein 1 n=1 Tax=Phlebotomus papatasi TaxID=29031 RepID=UPI00248443E8|nr:CAP-Gly domain-containing linker protein 1 [Phlebotomus papatasi]XP_055712236.1 CAP-Gly domain-containing linker protein 1 [Phlebotomus papatasi]